MFSFFKFYLSALPSLPPGSSSEHNLSVSFLALLPVTSWAFSVHVGKVSTHPEKVETNTKRYLHT
jgi:hypothetical protein